MMRCDSADYGRLFEAVQKEAIFDEILRNMEKKRIDFPEETKISFKSAVENFSSNLRSAVQENPNFKTAYSLIKNDAKIFAREMLSKMIDENERTYILFIYTEEGAASLVDPGAPNEFLDFYERQMDTLGSLSSLKEKAREKWMEFAEGTIKGSLGKSDMIIHYVKRSGRGPTEAIVTDFSDYARVIAESLKDATANENMDERRIRGRYLLYSTRRLGSLIYRSVIVKDAVLGGSKSVNFSRYVSSLYKLGRIERRSASALMSLFDKGMWKLIQAGSYAESYINHLEGIGVAEVAIPSKIVLFSKSSLFKYSVSLDMRRHRKVIKKCREIYGESKKEHDYKDPLVLFLPIMREIGKDERFAIDMHRFVKDAVLRKRDAVRRETFRLNGEDFSRLDMEFRKKHVRKIKEALDVSNLVFLTGSPGSGKTYALSRYGDTGTPFLYFSSRTKINVSALSTISEGAKEAMGASSIIVIMDYKDVNVKRGDDIIHYAPLHISADSDEERERIIKLLNSVYESTRLEADVKKSAGRLEFIDYSEKQSKRGDGYGGMRTENDDIRKKTVHTLSDQSVMKVAERVMEIIGMAIRDGGLEGYRVSYVGTVQSLEKAGRGSFLSFLGTVKSKIAPPLIMFDEITGSSKNIGFFKNLINGMGKNLSEMKIVISDASLVSRDIVVEMFGKKNTERRGKLFIEKKREETTEPTVKLEEHMNIGDKNVERVAIVEATAIPARNITVETVFVLNKAGKNRGEERIVGSMARDIIETFSRGKKAFVYIQNKSMIDILSMEMKSAYGETPRILKITADHVSQEIEEKIKNGDYDIVMATSSASRGLTFRDITEYFILFQNFSVADGLTEFEQVIVRGRGKGNDSETDKNYRIYFNYLFSTRGEKKTDIVRVYSRMMTDLFLTIKAFHLYSNYKGSTIKITPLPSIRNDGVGANIFKSTLKGLEKEIEKLERELNGENGEYVQRLKEAVSDMIYTAFEITSGVDKLYTSKRNVKERYRGLSYSKYVFPYAINSINEHLKTVYSGEGSRIISKKVEKINEILKYGVRKNIITRDRKTGIEKNLRFFSGGYDDKMFDKKSYIRVGTETFLFSSDEPDEVEIRCSDIISAWEGEGSMSELRSIYEKAATEEEKRRSVFDIFYAFGNRYEHLISDIFLLSRESVISSFGIPDAREERFTVRPKIHVEGKIENESAISIFPFFPIFLGSHCQKRRH